MSDVNNAMDEIQLVVFDLATEHYGVDISDVREIMRMQNITAVPGAMSYIEGVINLRGKVLPVLDLKKRLGLKAIERTEECRIMVIDFEEGEAGVIVDAVTEVLRVPNSTIDPPSSMVSQGNSDYLRGIAKLSDRLIILLDLHKLLSVKMITKELERVAIENPEEGVLTGEKPVDEGNGHNGKKKAVAAVSKNNNREYATV
jgi:purine-binding chemotaxis protein CheW